MSELPSAVWSFDRIIAVTGAALSFVTLGVVIYFGPYAVEAMGDGRSSAMSFKQVSRRSIVWRIA